MANKFRDGKDNFYRKLNLDTDTKKIIQYYRQITKKMKQESDYKNDNNTNDRS